MNWLFEELDGAANGQLPAANEYQNSFAFLDKKKIKYTDFSVWNLVVVLMQHFLCVSVRFFYLFDTGRPTAIPIWLNTNWY